MRRLFALYYLLATVAHSISRSKLVSVCGFITVIVSATSPQMFAGHPRVLAIFLALGSVAAAVGRALLAPSVPPQPDRVSGQSLRSIVPLLFLAPLLGLAFLSSACDKDQLHRAAVASDRMASLVSVGIDLKRELRAEDKIDDSSELELTRDLLDLNHAVTLLNDHARRYQTFNATAQGDLKQAFGTVSLAFAAFANDTTLHIKNPAAQARVAPVLASMRAAMSIIGAVLGNDSPRKPVPVHTIAPPRGPVAGGTEGVRQVLSGGGVYV